jgi:uncharacterized OsmC-like protein
MLLQAVATSLDIPLTGGTIEVEGDLDFRAIRLRYILDTSATTEQLDTLLRLTERYCVVYQTLAGAPELSSKWETVSVDG